MINAIKNKLTKKSAEIQTAVEYVAPYWVLLIRNPGQKGWNALRSKTEMVRVPNDFGTVVKTYPAIEKFQSRAEAVEYSVEHLGVSAQVARKDADIEKFLRRASQPLSYAPISE